MEVAAEAGSRVSLSVEPESRLLGASAPGATFAGADLNLQQIEKPSASRKKASERAPSSPQAYSGDGTMPTRHVLVGPGTTC